MLEKTHSSRPVGGAERTHSKAVAGGAGGPTFTADKQGGTTGEQDRPHNPGLQLREIKPQTSD